MSDKVQLIKQEIERLINDKTDGKHVAKADITAPKRAAYLDILNIIDTLPEESVSEDKSEKELAETYLEVFEKKYPILPTLKGKQKADFKNFLNKCQQEFGLKEFGIHPTQSKLFEKLTLLWAVWGAEHLEGLGKSNQDEFTKEPARKDWENTILNPNDTKIMYASRKAGIESFAETYSFNIESVLFNQLTLEQQKLWRKEIENAVINGGEMGLELANDKRYDKESSEDLEEAAYNYCEKVNHRQTDIITDSFKAGAEWQKEKDKEYVGAVQKISHQHGYDEGYEDCKQQMKKDAIDAESCTFSNAKGTYLHIKEGLDTKDGDIVKFIIIKEDKQ